MKRSIFIIFLMLSTAIFASSSGVVECGREQKKSFKSFLEYKKNIFQSKIDPSKDDYDCANYPSYKVIKAIDEIKHASMSDKGNLSEVCSIYFSYCNGAPQYSLPEVFGEDVEAWYTVTVITCDNVVAGLTMNRDECKEYFGL